MGKPTRTPASGSSSERRGIHPSAEQAPVLADTAIDALARLLLSVVEKEQSAGGQQ